jgi:isoamylase
MVTLCFKGIENFNYYRLVPDNLRYYMDYTGTGNTLNVMQARSLGLGAKSCIASLALI